MTVFTKPLAVTVAAVGLAAASIASGRPATSEESLVVRDAARILRGQGVHLPALQVQVLSANAFDAAGGTGAYAFAEPHLVTLSPQAAADARAFTAMVRSHDPAAAMAGCWGECSFVMVAAVHELVHVTRLRTPGGVWRGGWEEGLAEAVAADELCRFEYRVTRAHFADVPDAMPGFPPPRSTPACADPGVVYPEQVAVVREASARTVRGAWWSLAARGWRLRRVSAPIPEGAPA